MNPWNGESGARDVESPALTRSATDSTTYDGPVPAIVPALDASDPIAQRAHNGRFLPGHRINATHGLESERVPELYAALERGLLERSLLDDGGLSEIPARRQSQHEYRALIHRKV